MQNLNWVKLTNGGWCKFDTVNLSNVSATGVYIIWYSGNPSKVVYVGQGDIAARIKAHRANSDITRYSKLGDLYVTWATVPSTHLDGVERYLANTWNPLAGDTHPNVTPIAVNSPW